VITGVHALIYSPQAEAVRGFLREKLNLPFVDTGGGWLIFGLPPAEVGVHPSDGGRSHELHLMCDDIEATMAELAAAGVEFSGDVHRRDYGIETAVKLPDGSTIGLYQPLHPVANTLQR